jgi:hypothetical protein
VHCRRDVAAAVVEVHVDAVRARGLQCRAEVLGLVVDRLVVAVELEKVGLLVGPARDPDGAAARELCELADDLADRTGGA